MGFAKTLFPRECGLGAFWLRLFIAKSVMALLAIALVRSLPDLSPRIVVLAAGAAMMPFENHFAVFPRGRELGHKAGARAAAYLPILREFYIFFLMFSVRTPSSYLYASPYED